MSVEDLLNEIDREIYDDGMPSPETMQKIAIKLRLFEKVALYWKDDKQHLNPDVMDHLVRIALDQ